MPILNFGSSSESHEHPHTHNRYNPLHNEPNSDPNSYTDHHNPLNEYGGNSTKNFEHSHPHQHEDPSRIGHDPDAPDNLNGSIPARRYYMHPDHPYGTEMKNRLRNDSGSDDSEQSIFDEIYDFIFG